MSATALIRFVQGTIGPDGQAYQGVLGEPVTIENSDNAEVLSWEIDLVYVPYGSAQPVATPRLFSDSGDTPSFTFTPDARGSYRFVLKVWSVPNRVGDPDVDIRVFFIPEANRGFIQPPAQIFPPPLPPLESGLPGAKPNELNFEDQPFGWAANVPSFLNEVIRIMDATAGGGGSLPLSTVYFVDSGTTVPPSDQDGSTGAPFSTLQAAATAAVVAGLSQVTIYVAPRSVPYGNVVTTGIDVVTICGLGPSPWLIDLDPPTVYGANKTVKIGNVSGNGAASALFLQQVSAAVVQTAVAPQGRISVERSTVDVIDGSNAAVVLLIQSVVSDISCHSLHSVDSRISGTLTTVSAGQVRISGGNITGGATFANLTAVSVRDVEAVSGVFTFVGAYGSFGIDAASYALFYDNATLVNGRAFVFGRLERSVAADLISILAGDGEGIAAVMSIKDGVQSWVIRADIQGDINPSEGNATACAIGIKLETSVNGGGLWTVQTTSGLTFPNNLVGDEGEVGLSIGTVFTPPAGVDWMVRVKVAIYDPGTIISFIVVGGALTASPVNP